MSILPASPTTMEPDNDSPPQPSIAAQSDLTARQTWALTRKPVYICRIIWNQPAIDSPHLNATSVPPSSSSPAEPSAHTSSSNPLAYVSLNLCLGSNQVVRLSIRFKPSSHSDHDANADLSYWFLELLEYTSLTSTSHSQKHCDVRVRNCSDNFDPAKPISKSSSGKTPAKIVADWIAAIHETSTTRVRLSCVDGEEEGWRYFILALMTRMKDQNAFHADDASLMHLRTALQESQTSTHHALSISNSDSCIFIPGLRAMKRKPFTAADLATCVHVASPNAVKSLTESVMRASAAYASDEKTDNHDENDAKLEELVALLSSTKIDTHPHSNTLPPSSQHYSSLTAYLLQSPLLTSRAREFAKDFACQAHAKSKLNTHATLLADFISALDARKYTTAASYLRAVDTASSSSNSSASKRRSSVSKITERVRSLSRPRSQSKEMRPVSRGNENDSISVGEGGKQSESSSSSKRGGGGGGGGGANLWTARFGRESNVSAEEAEKIVLLLAAVIAMEGCPDGE